MPDGFVTISKDGIVFGGEKILLKRGHNLFDYVTSKCGVKILKKAMNEASEKILKDIEISFRYGGKKANYFCQIYKSDDRYLIGGWKLPENIIYFPNKDTAA